MRVVAGHLRGRRLTAPPGRDTRPTSDRVREALFSIVGPLDGARVLDLFAGSGALGIEALSRGARSATFVERDARAVAVMRRNLEALRLSDAALHRRDALAFLRAANATYDLIFLDPPYSCAPRLAGPLSAALPGVLSTDALIVTESDKRTPLLLELPLVLERTYGDTRIALHRDR
ncbi:MAG: 16S rRNA (guanine(966)-N(2))-methyltransferase [uncultured Solirubrobacterales bacterium]|uniref:16S rRNA (Guanine(966)-N(2))-methyltransferase n=1 Tax=uncultured Solirubrobacterales bacterium TaxID=768556 RepID=A0A6J4T596_9ACTN|nr:MAG: 16S rRNA (guanine(966)-N(2))-methyltransferase [uncultured Solirubrobacterales bacterium]